MDDPDALLQALRRTDRRIADRVGGTPGTLAPNRTQPTSLEELGDRIERDPKLSEGARTVLLTGVESIARAILDAFPRNFFWDLDALVGALQSSVRAETTEPTDAPETLAALEERIGIIVAVQELFGGRSPIRFQYAHDFVYGFDWAKWVQKDPDHRRDIGPYDAPFLTALYQRGLELLTLIRNDDTTYPTLRGPSFRNPFGFSREPAEERQLHEVLAAKAWIPVAAWEIAPTPAWDQPYAARREEAARELGIGTPVDAR